jgi:Protein of unknown function (DUF3567)
MEMLYNSDSFTVVQIEWPAEGDAPARGGYEIVDKHARKGIFIEGALAEGFKAGVQALIDREDPSADAFDDFIEGYTELAQQPLVLH